MQKLRIVSRKSKLALWQANFVKEQLQIHYPALMVEIIGITTAGDMILDTTLDKLGGKGLFIKELEKSLLAHTADIAVHSLKDMPAKLPAMFTLGAILKREDAADAFVSNCYLNLEEMPEGAVIGTSSARRIAILQQHYPHIKIKLLRGNIQTRLSKLDNGEYDAIILAIAGLKRLNLTKRITQRLDINQFLPAIGQGALVLEILSARPDLIDILQPLVDVDTMLEVNMERMLGSQLAASCSMPIAIHAHSVGTEICLDARIWDIERNYCCQSRIQLDKSKSQEVLSFCLDELYQNGAKQIIAQYLV